MDKKALLILNPNSRRGGQKGREAVKMLEGLGLRVFAEPCKPSVNLTRLIGQYRDQVDVIAVAGGDGTLNAAADGLVQAKKPLGILPLGTANDLALSLGIPKDLGEACRVIAQGKPSPIDLGWANGRHFFNVASMGLSVEITRKLNPGVKRSFGSLAYLLAGIRALRQAKPFSAVIESAEGIFEVYSIQINIGNGRHFGGGLTIAEAASHVDGLLDLYSIEPERKWRMLSLLPALKNGTLHKTWGVRTLQGREFKISTKEPLAVNIDGEIRLSTPLKVRVVPKAIPVLLPRA